MNAEHEFISSPTTVSEHYNAEYFQFQAPIGEFGAWANIRHFSGYVKPDMKVLDFVAAELLTRKAYMSRNAASSE